MTTFSNREIFIGTILFLIILSTEIFRIPVTHYFPFADKIIHAVAAFGGIYFLSRFISIRKSVFIVLLLLTGVEFIQHYMPSREASIGDMLANSVGIAFAWWFCSTKKTCD